MITISTARTREDFDAAEALCKGFGEWDVVAAEPFGLTREQLIPAFHSDTSESLAAGFGTEEARILIARFDGAPAGMLSFNLFDETTAELQKFFVDPKFRGKQIGRELIGTALAGFRKDGRQRVLVHTAIYMTNAIALYESSGFTRCPRFRPTPGMVKHTDVFLSQTL